MPTNKYAEGYPGKRYYGGCEVVDEIEELARRPRDGALRRRARQRAAARRRAGEHGRLLRRASSRATGCSALSLDHGGHLTHGLKVNFSGKLYEFHHYGVSRETMMVDYDEVLAQAKEVGRS